MREQFHEGDPRQTPQEKALSDILLSSYQRAYEIGDTIIVTLRNRKNRPVGTSLYLYTSLAPGDSSVSQAWEYFERIKQPPRAGAIPIDDPRKLHTITRNMTRLLLLSRLGFGLDSDPEDQNTHWETVGLGNRNVRYKASETIDGVYLVRTARIGPQGNYDLTEELFTAVDEGSLRKTIAAYLPKTSTR